MTITQLKTARHYGINLTALEVLLTLAEDGDLSMSLLADKVGISTAAITGTADSLAKKQLVKRSASESDRRTIWLTLTEIGRVRIHQITGEFPEPPPRRVDCGSGHDYGICPVCKQGHGHVLIRNGRTTSSLKTEN